MTERDRALLMAQMESIRNTVRRYAAAFDDLSPEGRRAIYDLADSEGVPPDDFDLYESLDQWPLEVVDERGREFAVVLCTGGPHIEIVADGGCQARLEGYWGGDTATLRGDEFSTLLDYFIER